MTSKPVCHFLWPFSGKGSRYFARCGFAVMRAHMLDCFQAPIDTAGVCPWSSVGEVTAVQLWTLRRVKLAAKFHCAVETRPRASPSRH